MTACSACGDDANSPVDSGPPIDAPKPSVCWPDEPHEMRGTIEAGTGSTSFAQVPPMMQLFYGEQGGFHVEAQALITGLEPGDPMDVLSPANPYTRFTVYFADDLVNPTSTAHCGYRRGYVPSPDQPGAFILAIGELHQFNTCYRPEDLFDKDMLMRVEIVDATNGYAMNEVRFHALQPANWNPENPPPTGNGCARGLLPPTRATE